jgi:hypothetical protein
LNGKPVGHQNRHMSMNWLSRVARSWSTYFDAPDYVCDWDADARRARIDLDAIRVRFPDHA